jgi:hypothetical protein
METKRKICHLLFVIKNQWHKCFVMKTWPTSQYYFVSICQICHGM